MTEIFGAEYHEADLAEYIIGAYRDELMGVAYFKPTLIKGTSEFGIVVKEEYQGQGLGNKLLNNIEAEADKENITLIAKTLISNDAINKLLVGHGWKIVKRYFHEGFQYLKRCPSQ